MRATATLPKALGGGLTLRAVSSPADVQRYIDLNAAVTNEGDIAARLLYHHPATTDADYWLVVDEATGKAVSTTCLLPWQCTLDGLPLRVAMLEMVVTDPTYRKRGLVRAQIAHFHAVVAERGFDLCIIQGIPYYYRQFGYAYAVDHTPLTALSAWQIPDDLPTDAPPVRWRRATVEDIPELTRLYAATMAQHQFTVVRDADGWRYLLQHKAHPVQVIRRRESGQTLGYLVPSTPGSPLRLYEHGVLDEQVGLAVLGQLKAESAGEIHIPGPPSDRLVALARSLGGRALPVADQWLWRIPAVGALLQKLSPLFANRLQGRVANDRSESLTINLYREAYQLQSDRGQVTATPLGFVDASLGAAGGDLNIPPDAFVRLLLGNRTLDELTDAWPDLRVKPAKRYLVEALFPQRTAHILMPY